MKERELLISSRLQKKTDDLIVVTITPLQEVSETKKARSTRERSRLPLSGGSSQNPTLTPGKRADETQAAWGLGGQHHHPIYAGFGEPSLPRSLAERRLPTAAPDLSIPSLAGFPFGLLCGARTPRSGGGGPTPGARRVRPAAKAPRPDFVALCPEAARRAQAQAQRAERPGTRKPALREKKLWAQGSLRRRSVGSLLAWAQPAAGAELPPLARIPRPRRQTPPPVPSVPQSLAWPRGHLGAGSGSQGPAPTPSSPARGPGAGWTSSPSSTRYTGLRSLFGWEMGFASTNNPGKSPQEGSFRSVFRRRVCVRDRRR
ncbi:translation initiation factor IF-2-like [Lutra lutra]|uniref:translation initiation factor IF-2-like n=1 Tax=Lutra lutra TaxID=9657 RepID=UPI001FD2365C|nr:translation initiation factor IF-2-like [Lutra lutra]